MIDSLAKGNVVCLTTSLSQLAPQVIVESDKAMLGHVVVGYCISDASSDHITLNTRCVRDLVEYYKVVVLLSPSTSKTFEGDIPHLKYSSMSSLRSNLATYMTRFKYDNIESMCDQIIGLPYMSTTEVFDVCAELVDAWSKSKSQHYHSSYKSKLTTYVRSMLFLYDAETPKAAEEAKEMTNPNTLYKVIVKPAIAAKGKNPAVDPVYAYGIKIGTDSTGRVVLDLQGLSANSKMNRIQDFDPKDVEEVRQWTFKITFGIDNAKKIFHGPKDCVSVGDVVIHKPHGMGMVTSVNTRNEVSVAFQGSKVMTEALDTSNQPSEA